MKKEHVKTVYSNSSQEAIEHAKSAWKLGFVVDIKQTRLESSFEELRRAGQRKDVPGSYIQVRRGVGGIMLKKPPCGGRQETFKLGFMVS